MTTSQLIKTKKVQMSNKARKNIEEAIRKSEGKTPLNLVCVGHVDAGKSTLMGQILYLTGMVEDKIIEKCVFVHV